MRWNQGPLLYGLRRSERSPNLTRPLAYGRELHFRSFVVALMIFASGGAPSIYEGLVHIRHPEPIVRLEASQYPLYFHVLRW